MDCNLHNMQPVVNQGFAYHALEAVCALCKTEAVKINLYELRERLGLTLEEMAERVQYSVSMLSRWENGKANIPSGNLPALAGAYQCRVQDIFTDDGDAPILMPNEAVLADLLKDVQQELPASLPYGAWPQSAASALHMRIVRLSGAHATHTSQGAGKKPGPAKDAQLRPPTKSDARA